MTSLEAHSNLAAADIPCTRVGAIGSPTEQTTFGASLAKETLLTGEEAITNATAAETVAEAKAAANVSGDARMMFGHYSSSKLDGKSAISPSEAGTTQLAEIGLVGVGLGSTLAKNGLGKNSYPTEEADDLEQILDSVAVRSRSQTEGKARREKTWVKSVFTNSKRHASLPYGEYYDPNASTPRLLTRAEEQELSEGIQDLLKLEKVREELDDDASFAEWADKAGLDEETLRYRFDHGMRCKDKMIRSNVGLVVMVAKTFMRPGRNLRELVRLGCQGLERGAEKFDPTKGKFSSYAPWWIAVAIRQYLYDHSSFIRLNKSLIDAVKKVEEAQDRLYSKYGRPPSKEALAKATRLSMKTLQFLLLLPKAPISLNQMPRNDQNDQKFERLQVIEYGGDYLKRMDKLYLKEELQKVLDTTLTAREKQVINLRFGMEGGRTMTLQEIGDVMGVTRERIRQIESAAFQKLKSNDSLEDLLVSPSQIMEMEIGDLAGWEE